MCALSMAGKIVRVKFGAADIPQLRVKDRSCFTHGHLSHKDKHESCMYTSMYTHVRSSAVLNFAIM